MKRWFVGVCGFVAVAAVAEGTITVDLIPTDTSPAPQAGARREVGVWLTNDNPQEVLGGFQFAYQADRAGVFTAVGAIGGAGSGGNGSRYNSPNWDGNTVTGLAISPPAGAVPVAPDSLGLYGTVIVNGDPHAASQLVGYIVVDIKPPIPPVWTTLSVVGFQAFSLLGDSLETRVGKSYTVGPLPPGPPEPASALLMFTGLACVMRAKPSRRHGV